MDDAPEISRRVALLEEKVDELHDRLRTIETWSVETYQYQYSTRANLRLQPPAPLWRQRAASAWAQAATEAGPQIAPPPVAGPVEQPFAPPITPAAAVLPSAAYAVPLSVPPVAPPGADARHGAPPGQPAPATPVPPGTPLIPQTPAGQWPFPAPPRPERRRSFADLEQAFSGRILAGVGGLAVLLGAIFFLGLAFTRGWIGPAGRVGIGMVAGLALVAGGAWFFERRETIFGHVLLAVGLGTTSIALIAATRLYDLFPASIGLVGALVVAVVAAVVAIRADVQIVAGYGLVTALAAPPLLGARPDLATIAFLAAALIGTTAIALYRTWNWLPSVAFLLSAPQLASWLASDAPLVVGLIALVGFWALNTLAAGGEEFRIRRDRLSVTATTLLLATAAFLVTLGFALLDRHDADGAHGLFLLLTACAYGAVGAYFLRTRGATHGFGLLAAGTGVAALTMAVPIQFGGPVVPIAWAAEAAALAWVYGRRNHRYSGIAGAVLGTLAVLHLVTVEYPFVSALGLATGRQYGRIPFLDASGGTLLSLLLAFAVAALFVRAPIVRASLAAVGHGLVLYALPFETRDIGLVIGWSILFITVFAIERVAPRVAARFPLLATTAGDRTIPNVLRWLRVGVTAIVTILYTLVALFPTSATVADTPFADCATLATAILVAASLAAALLTTARLMRRIAVIAPFVLIAGLLPYELHEAAVVVGYAALAGGLVAIARRDRAALIGYLSVASVLLQLGVLNALFNVAPPSRLAIHAAARIQHPLFLSGASAALGAVILVLAFVAWSYPKTTPWLLAVAGTIAVYALSVGIVDAFQGAVTALTTHATLVSLAKQAQVALSITWATLGGAAFIIGAARRSVALRVGGLALLGVATAKVFLFDLASLDATYRVPSFIGLGILLLVSSYVYQRLKPNEVAPVAS